MAKEDNIGALWKADKLDANGNEFYTGTIRMSKDKEIKIKMFVNRFKGEGERRPDFNLCLQKEYEKPCTPDAMMPVTFGTPAKYEKIPLETKYPLKTTAVTSDEDCPF